MLKANEQDAPAAGVVSSAERLNGALAGRWQQFAKQPYFDRQGIFFSALVSAPLLITMAFLLVGPSGAPQHVHQ